jgi:hypothetical protein
MSDNTIAIQILTEYLKISRATPPHKSGNRLEYMVARGLDETYCEAVEDCIKLLDAVNHPPLDTSDVQVESSEGWCCEYCGGDHHSVDCKIKPCSLCGSYYHDPLDCPEHYAQMDSVFLAGEKET